MWSSFTYYTGLDGLITFLHGWFLTLWYYLDPLILFKSGYAFVIGKLALKHLGTETWIYDLRIAMLTLGQYISWLDWIINVPAFISAILLCITFESVFSVYRTWRVVKDAIPFI